MSIRLSALVILLLSLCSPAQADAPASVYLIHPELDVPVIGLATLGIIYPYSVASHLITRRCPCDPNEVGPLDRGAIGNASGFADSFSDATAAVAAGAPLVLDYLDQGWNHPLLEDAVVYAEVLSVNGALVTLAKYAAQRPLPRVYADPTSDLASQPGGFRSFYSGHTSLVFSGLTAAAMTYHLRHGASLWPWLITAGIGTSVAIERVLAGRHFPTDVAFGALAGMGVGTLIPLLHERPLGKNTTLAPIAGAGQLGLMAVRSF